MEGAAMEGAAVGSAPYMYRSGHWEGVLGGCRHRARKHQGYRVGMLRAS